MEKIEISSTSARTAECSPIVLRQTERVRLVFRPTLVENSEDPKACIRGDFVYQRKSFSGEWESSNTISLVSIKAGEAYKLELRSAELLDLIEALGPLYRARWKDSRLTFGRKTYVRLETSVARFMRLGQSELEKLLNAHPDEAVSVLQKLLQWVAASALSKETAEALSSLDPEQLPSVTALVGLSALKSAVSEWESNRSNASEPFWQKSLSDRSYVLSQLFAYPIVVIGERAYLGGKSIGDRGGSYLDFLAAAAATKAIVLIEIKTPKTALLSSDYRAGAYPPSAELSGAISQVLKYKRTFRAEFEKLGRPEGLVFAEPRCIVIAGDVENQLDTPDKSESFEEFRRQLKSVDVIGYDELFSRVKTSADLLEQVLGYSG